MGAADFFSLHPAFLLRQNRNDLFLTELRSSHVHLLVDGLYIQTTDQSG